jgi:hypothetical protein
VSSASTSATRDTLRFAFPLSGLPGPRSPECFLRSRSSPPSTRGSTAPPPFSKCPAVRTRGEQPSHVFISPSITQCPCNCSPELVAPSRDLSHRGLRPLVPPCRFCTHGRVSHVALNVPDPFSKPLDPRRGRPLVSGEPSPRDRAASLCSCPAPGCRISGVRPRFDGLGLIRADLISALRSGSDRSSLSPSPAPPQLGPAGQPALVR